MQETEVRFRGDYSVAGVASVHPSAAEQSGVGLVGICWTQADPHPVSLHREEAVAQFTVH